MKFVAVLDSTYKNYGFRCALAACLLLPLKLSLAYICLVPLLLLWLVNVRLNIWRALNPGSSVIMPYVFFVLVAFVGLFFGFDPGRSLEKLSGVAFFGLTMLAIRDVCATEFSRCEKLLLTLVAGQTIAAFYSVLEGAFGPALPRIFIGAVSESGQLAITVPIACGLILLHSRSPLDNSGPGEVRRKMDCVLSLVNFLAFTLFAFSWVLKVHAPLFSIELGLCALLIAVSLGRLWRLWKYNHAFSERCGTFLKTVALPLLLAALLANLKRGPWMGVLIGGAILLLIERRKLTLALVLVAAALLGTMKPIQERLARSEEHFFIVGGRSEIWDIGVELAKRFPLGVGYRNSNMLQKFSDNVPAELTHFHNNLLNVVVEVGWLGLAVFLWWIFSILQAAFSPTPSRQQRIVRRALGCAIISWQTAGLVEYNFGDSEVVLVVLVITGILAAMMRQEEGKLELHHKEH